MKNDLSKMLHRLCSPPRGRVTGCRVSAESHPHQPRFGAKLVFVLYKLLFSFIILPDVLNSLISRCLLAACRLHLGFLEKLVLKVGFYLRAVFPSRNLGLMRISRWRFKQSENCSFIPRIYVLLSFVHFWGYLGGDSFSQWISEIWK